MKFFTILIGVVYFSSVCGQRLHCSLGGVTGFTNGTNITTEQCMEYLELCPPSNYTSRFDNRNILFVTCQAKENKTVKVNVKCNCGQGMSFNSAGSKPCVRSSNVSPGLNIVFDRPNDTSRERLITTYVENFNLNSAREIMISCIVYNDSVIDNEAEEERYTLTVNYISSSQTLLMPTLLLQVIFSLLVFFTS